ncbi:MAG: hypothetical protein ACU84J_00750 [Gammaproteobacteria bacterium]
MDNLSLRLDPQKMAPRKSIPKDAYDSVSSEELLELFPLPRYFQIHFGHIHDNAEAAKHQLNELKESLDRVEKKLDRLLASMAQGCF